MKKGLSTILFVLIILIIGLIGAILGYQYSISKNAKTFQSETTKQTSGLKNYQNKQYGFSLEYPSDWSVIENGASYQKMCEAQLKTDGSTPDSITTICQSKNPIVYFSNINGFCTKGGCVDKNLKPIVSPPLLQEISIWTATAKEKDDYQNTYNQKTTVDGQTVDFIDQPYLKDEQTPYSRLFWTAPNGQLLTMATATETGAEQQERAVFGQMMKSMKLQ